MPSTFVREGIGIVVVVVITDVVEREGEDVVGIAILPTSPGKEVESRGCETLEPGRDSSGFDLPFLCGVSEGTGEECVALGAWLVMTTLFVVFKTEELTTEVVESTEVVTEVVRGVLPP